MKKMRTVFRLIAAMILVTWLYGCGAQTEPPVSEEEIMMKIKLDVKEDIGILTVDADINGAKTKGGISNMDKSLIKHNDVLYWSFAKQDYNVTEDTVSLTVQFKVVTEYCDPNYDNIYPEELVMELEPVTLTADFGKMYTVTVTGNHTDGYKAVLEE